MAKNCYDISFKVETSAFQPRNLLDSTAPRPRGKERSKPKAGKPKTFRKILNKEKEEAASKCEQSTKGNDWIGKQLNEPDSDVAGSPQPYEDATASGGHSSNQEREVDGKKEGDEDAVVRHLKAALSSINSEKIDSLTAKLSEVSMLDVDELVECVLHFAQYREYCDQSLTNELEMTSYEILLNLIRFQDRLYQKFHKKDMEKFNLKRRFVCGLNEVKKFVKQRKAKAVLIAPDVEKIVKNGILEQTINDLIKLCGEQDIPIVFISSRSKLAKVCCKSQRSSLTCIAILDYGGTQDEFHKMIELANQAREDYKATRKKLVDHLKSLTLSELEKTSQEIEVNGGVPEFLLMYREEVYKPLFQNVYKYIKIIKQKRKVNS